MRTLALLFVCLCGVLQAQDPIGILEGQVADPSSAVVSGAQVTAQNVQTGLRQTVVTCLLYTSVLMVVYHVVMLAR